MSKPGTPCLGHFRSWNYSAHDVGERYGMSASVCVGGGIWVDGYTIGATEVWEWPICCHTCERKGV